MILPPSLLNLDMIKDCRRRDGLNSTISVQEIESVHSS